MPLRGIVQADDACRGGERTGGKRGRGAAGKTPFAAAVQVTADGCERVPAVTGGGKRSCADSRFVRASTMPANVKQSLAGTCHSLDGKRLPRCLAGFRYRFNRRCDAEALVPRLVHASVRTPPMPYRLLTLAESCG